MKRVRINAGKVGLVFKRGDYKRVITAGQHWLSAGERVELFNMTRAFVAPVELNILLEDIELSSMLEVINVSDGEIVLQFEKGRFNTVLIPGQYAFWKGVIDYTFIRVDLSKNEITEDVPKSVYKTLALSTFLRVYKVESYEKGVLLEDGKFVRFLDKGSYYFWNTPIPLEVLKADLRQLQLEISGQEILTADKATLRINFFAKYRIVDVQKALMDNKDCEKQLYILLQLGLREYIGKFSLDELLQTKDSVSDAIMGAVAEKAASLGIEILDCGIRDIILPGEVREIMNQVLVAQKRAQANIITRREETASTRSLLNTAKLIEDNPMLFKLKEMEYVEKIAEKINNISLSGGNQIVDQLREIFT